MNKCAAGDENLFDLHKSDNEKRQSTARMRRRKLSYCGLNVTLISRRVDDFSNSDTVDNNIRRNAEQSNFHSRKKSTEYGRDRSIYCNAFSSRCKCLTQASEASAISDPTFDYKIKNQKPASHSVHANANSSNEFVGKKVIGRKRITWIVAATITCSVLAPFRRTRRNHNNEGSNFGVLASRITSDTSSSRHFEGENMEGRFRQAALLSRQSVGSHENIQMHRQEQFEQRRRRRKRILQEDDVDAGEEAPSSNSSLFFESLSICSQTSLELSQMEPFASVLEPCILYDIKPNNTSLFNAVRNNTSSSASPNNGTTDSVTTANNSNNNNVRRDNSPGLDSPHSSRRASTLDILYDNKIEKSSDDTYGRIFASREERNRGGSKIQESHNRRTQDSNLSGESSVITLVQVTPATCREHRDGAALAVQEINSYNQGRGLEVGNISDEPNNNATPSSSNFSNQYVQFRLISIIGGNLYSFSNETLYTRQHSQLLQGILSSPSVNVDFIVGTCSFTSAIVQEAELAQEYGRLLLTQVGPPSYYDNIASSSVSNNNFNYVFGMHRSSLDYTIPVIRQMSLTSLSSESSSASPLSVIPVHVLYRDSGTKSDLFLQTTCQSTLAQARVLGFESIKDIPYDPYGDDDRDGLRNEFDLHFMQNLAKDACTSSQSLSSSSSLEIHPAIYVCVASDFEINSLLQTWKSMQCRPSLLWTTSATWGWAYGNSIEDNVKMKNDNNDHDPLAGTISSLFSQIPYMMGSSQWHPNFASSQQGDKFLQSASHFEKRFSNIFGYKSTYDAIVSYSIPTLVANLIETHFSVKTTVTPNNSSVGVNSVTEEFIINYDGIRRTLLNQNFETMMGSINFHSRTQQNIGGQVASIQWLPANTSGNVSINATSPDVTPKLVVPQQLATSTSSTYSTSFYHSMLTSPLDLAQATMIIPSPDAKRCEDGEHYVEKNLSFPLLTNKCEPCPVNTYRPLSDTTGMCMTCPAGSSTNGRTGSHFCVVRDPNLLGVGVQVLGYTLMGVIWIMSGLSIGWLIWYRLDPVVIIGQFQFLLVICIGAFISSSTILPLTVQADVGESTWGATIGCRAAPFLYTTGWVLEYSSLSAKTFRLFKLTASGDQFRRQTIHAKNMYAVIVVPLLIDLLIVTIWTIVDPLTYVRIPIGISEELDQGIIIKESVGRCQTLNYPIWAWILPIVVIHLGLMILTNILLYRVRKVHTRYQERRHVGLASLLVLEVALVGIPILAAVRDNPTSSYIVYLGIICLNDLVILSCIFVPKVKYQRKGLPQGVEVADSIIPPSIHRRSSIMSGGVSSSLDGGGGHGFDTVEAMRRRSSLLTSNHSETLLANGASPAGTVSNGSRLVSSKTTHGAYNPSQLNERDGLTRSRVGNAPGRRPSLMVPREGQRLGMSPGHRGSGRPKYPPGRPPKNGAISMSMPHATTRDPLVRTRRGHTSSNNIASSQQRLTRSLVGRHDRSFTTTSQLNRSRVGFRSNTQAKQSQSTGEECPSSKQDRFGPFTGELARALRAAAAIADEEGDSENDEEKEAESVSRPKSPNEPTLTIGPPLRQESAEKFASLNLSESGDYEKEKSKVLVKTKEMARSLLGGGVKKERKESDADKAGLATAATVPSSIADDGECTSKQAGGASLMTVVAAAKLKRRVSRTSSANALQRALSGLSGHSSSSAGGGGGGSVSSSGHRRPRRLSMGRRGSGGSSSLGGSTQGGGSGRGVIRRLSIGARRNSLDLSDDEDDDGYTYDINGELLERKSRQPVQRRDSLLKDISHFSMIVEELEADEKDKTNKGSDEYSDDSSEKKAREEMLRNERKKLSTKFEVEEDFDNGDSDTEEPKKRLPKRRIMSDSSIRKDDIAAAAAAAVAAMKLTGPRSAANDETNSSDNDADIDEDTDEPELSAPGAPMIKSSVMRGAGSLDISHHSGGSRQFHTPRGSRASITTNSATNNSGNNTNNYRRYKLNQSQHSASSYHTAQVAKLLADASSQSGSNALSNKARATKDTGPSLEATKPILSRRTQGTQFNDRKKSNTSCVERKKGNNVSPDVLGCSRHSTGKRDYPEIGEQKESPLRTSRSSRSLLSGTVLPHATESTKYDQRNESWGSLSRRGIPLDIQIEIHEPIPQNHNTSSENSYMIRDSYDSKMPPQAQS